MIACYRRITCFVPKNVCRLCSGYYHFKKPDGSVQTIRTNQKIKPNVRVLFISEPKFSDENKVSCVIRVNAGSYEDKSDCEGLAHLTEHVIAKCVSNERIFCYHCETSYFYTLFGFPACINNLLDDFGKWTKYIFSSDELTDICDVTKTILNEEVNRVDNEFYERVTVVEKLTRILSDEQLIVDKFRWGNRKTLNKEHDDDLMEKLEDYRILFRKRPVFVCLVTKNEISPTSQMDILNSLLKYRNEEQDVQSINWENECSEDNSEDSSEDSSKDNSKYLLIVEADNVEHEWNIFFPYTTPLNEKEEKSLKFYGDIISTEIEDYLVHYLREEKMATEIKCQSLERGFAIAINLTDAGLEHIREVSSDVKKYLKFIHDNWLVHDKHMYRKNEEIDKSSLVYVMDLAEKSFYQKFDYRKKKNEPLTKSEERVLISKQILENEEAVHIIRARDPVQVKNVLGGLSILNESMKKKDVIYGQTYFICETDLLKGFSKDFELFDFSNYKTDGHSEMLKILDYAAVFKPDDHIFQKYLITYMTWKSLHLQALCRRDKRCLAFEQYHENVIVTWTSDEITYLFNSLDPYSVSEEEFHQCKQYLMREMSLKIIDSSQLARSLMETAVTNHRLFTIKANPLPKQYRQLQLMDCSAYGNHFIKQKKFIYEEEKRPKLTNSNRQTCNETFVINSINENELTTVTHIFCKTISNKEDAVLFAVEEKLRLMQRRLGLYTVNVLIDEVGGATGFYMKIVSVENNIKQESTDILHKLGEILERTILFPAKGAKKPAESVIFDYQIIVQIKGNKELNGNKHPFDEAFEIWFKHHQKVFQRITEMPVR